MAVTDCLISGMEMALWMGMKKILFLVAMLGACGDNDVVYREAPYIDCAPGQYVIACTVHGSCGDYADHTIDQDMVMCSTELTVEAWQAQAFAELTGPGGLCYLHEATFDFSCGVQL